ncbi:reverse transcriptase (RNA-dependent DNA polymerase)-domain-containing protein [Peziza echinospora]|nr:reverse transcriptase (RNA-dependent DNA polymerase)-domain-containing protein [Peziza echinospora]
MWANSWSHQKTSGISETILHSHKKLIVTRVYASPDTRELWKKVEDMLENITTQGHVMMGDFNTHHAVWGGPDGTTTSKGRRLIDILCGANGGGPKDPLEARRWVLERSIKEKNMCKWSKRWWTPEIAELRKEFWKHNRRIRSHFQLAQAKESKKRFNKAVKKSKEYFWNAYVEEVDNDPNAAFWKACRIMTTPFGQNSKNRQFKGPDQRLATSDDEKVKAFRKSLYGPPEELNDQGGQDEEIEWTSPQGYDRDEVYIWEELRLLLAKTSNNSAPGPDGVPYKILKILKILKHKESTLYMGVESAVNRAAQVGRPLGRDSKLVIIPKPGKNHEEVNGYRPISLANMVDKWLEKLVAKDLQRSDLLVHSSVIGGLQGRAAIDEITAAVSREGSGGASFINFLGSNPRTVPVEWNGVARGYLQVTGTPQGSPLSPILFMIAILEAMESTQRLNPSVRITCYADDIRLENLGGVEALLRAEGTVKRELSEQGFQLDPNKTGRIRFGDYDDKVKYLGIIFTSRLDPREHAERRLTIATKAWNAGRGFVKLLSPRNKRILWTSRMSTMALYGAITWTSRQQQLAEEVEKLQYRVTRTITGCWNGSSRTKLRQLASLPSIQERLLEEKVATLTRAIQSNNQVASVIREVKPILVKRRS